MMKRKIPQPWSSWVLLCRAGFYFSFGIDVIVHLHR